MIDAPDRIEGEGFSLRALREDDAPRYVQAFRDDPRMAYWWGVEADPGEETVRGYARAEAERRAEGRGVSFTIAGPGDELIGGLNFHRIEPVHRRAEIGFWLIPAARGRGLAAAAVELATRWAMRELGFARVEMLTLPDNEPVLRLAERIGYRREGLLRARNFERGQRVDIVMLAAVASDWE